MKEILCIKKETDDVHIFINLEVIKKIIDLFNKKDELQPDLNIKPPEFDIVSEGYWSKKGE